MLKCKAVKNLELAKSDLAEYVIHSLTPLPKSLADCSGYQLGFSLSDKRRIILTFVRDGAEVKLTAEFEPGAGSNGSLFCKVVGKYPKTDDPEKPIRECLSVLINQIYSL